MNKNKTNHQLKMLILGAWILFTSTMVIWWWIHGLNDAVLKVDNAQSVLKQERMLLWEGTAFLTAILLAGFSLWKLIKQDLARHNQLKMFFGNFSHDIKTSITRLRLQSEVLQDEKAYVNDEKLKQLIQDISRLDLQLENSLYIAQENDYQVFIEQIQLSGLIQNIKVDFPEVDIYLEKDILIQVDKRLFICVLRNIINNSVVHAMASEIKIKVNLLTPLVELVITDNGEASGANIKGHGLGINLCQQLLNKMNGQFKIILSNPNFVVSIKITGAKI